ncbi:hypothetical protein [Zooshikella ganghwensis]|uniref:hypothetical protein n=1 Tax=Zooshikella ganghwensis TaxID=202772 RepID=UPI00041F8D7B|nr:hypothetical protein [Zooshikella ganghwensis]
MAKDNFVTPRGILGPYPHLNKADTKFDSDGVYDARLIISPEAAKPLIAQIEKRFEEHYQKLCQELRKKKLKKADLPFEEDEETGNVVFKFKVKAKGKRKDGTIFTRRPILYDTKNNVIPEDKILGQGSEVRISTVFYHWYAPSTGVGITLQPEAVRVYQLEEYAFQANASFYGFEDEEEGFTIEDENIEVEDDMDPVEEEEDF